MNLLRWILLAVGAVVIVAIYLWGRRSRRTQSNAHSNAQPNAQANDQPDNRPTASSARQTHAYEPVNIPELDEAVSVRIRAAESSTVITDGLPPMHAGGEADAGAFMQAAMPQRNEPELFIDEADDVSTVFIATTAEAAPMRAPPEVTPRPAKKIPSRKIVALRLSAGTDGVEGARLKLLLEAADLRHGKYSIYHRLHTDGSPLFSVASMVEPGTFDPFAMNSVKFPGITLFMQLPGSLAGDAMLAQLLACARELEQAMSGVLQEERGMPLTAPREQRLREDVADFLHLLGPH